MKKQAPILVLLCGCVLSLPASAQDKNDKSEDKSKDSQQQSLPAAPSAVAEEEIRKQQGAPPPAPEKKPAEKKADEPVLKSLKPPTPVPAPAPASDPAPKVEAKQDPAAAPPATQSAPPNDLENDPAATITVRSNEVNVLFTVTDKKGNFIKDLKREDFSVLDDNHQVEKFASFSAQSNLPLRVGLLIDSSSSIHERFKFEQESAIEFLSQILRPKEDKAFVVSFDSTQTLEVPFTNRTELLADAVRRIKASGGTALYDAVYFSARDVILKQRENSVVRRAIILLSDGDDNVSHVTREEAVEMAQRAELTIYCISTNISGQYDKAGDKTLARFSEATGGRTFHPFKAEDVANAFSDIQAELRSQYAISYRPPNLVADGRYRSIDINSPNKKLRIRARKGYFAPK